MGLLSKIKDYFGYNAPSQNVFTNKVNPALQRQFYNQQQDPRRAFTQQALNVRENIKELPRGIDTAIQAPYINRVQQKIDLQNEGVRTHILKRIRQEPDPLKRQKLSKILTTVQTPNVLQEVNPLAMEEGYANRIGGTFFDVASTVAGLGSPAVALGKGALSKYAAKGALERLASYGLVRGAEGAIYQTGRDIATEGKIDPRKTINTAALGALGNAALSPRLTAGAGEQVFNNLVRSATPDATGVLSRSPGFAKVPGADQGKIMGKDLLNQYKGRGEHIHYKVKELANKTNFQKVKLDPKKIGGSFEESIIFSNGSPADIARYKRISSSTDNNPIILDTDGNIIDGYKRVANAIKKGEMIEAYVPIKADPLEALKNEARKYKSADEFVRKTVTAERGDDYARLKGIIKQEVNPDTFGIPLSGKGDIRSSQSIDEVTVQKYMKQIEDNVSNRRLDLNPPVIIDNYRGFNEIVDGHNRAEAYRRLGYTDAPIIKKSQLTSLYNEATKATNSLESLKNEAKSNLKLPKGIKPTRIELYGSATKGKTNPNDYDVAVFLKPEDLRKVDTGFWGVTREKAQDGKYLEYRYFEDSPNGLKKFAEAVGHETTAKLPRSPGFVKIPGKSRESLTGKALETPTVKLTRETTDFKTSFRKWIGKREAAKTTGTILADKLNQVPKELHGEIIAGLEGKAVSGAADGFISKFRQQYDDLFNQAKKVGVDIRYLENYVTHIWERPAGEVAQAYQVAKRKFNFAGERLLPTYEEGLKMGLKPKYTNPAQIIGEYTRKLEETKANINFLDELKANGNLVSPEQGQRLPGFKPVHAEGIGGNWYAPSEVADKVNKIFSPESAGTIGKGLSIGAKISGGAQDLLLSGGIPGTPVNAFTIAQVTKEVMGGRVVSPLVSVFKSLSSGKSREFFAENAGQIKKLQENGVPVNSNFDLESLGEKTGLKNKLGDVWNKVVNQPTFKRFMPMLHVNLFNDVEKSLLKAGKPASEATEIAAKAVKNFYGITDVAVTASRSQTSKDFFSTVFFAPRYRESMINFWINNVKALKNPLAPENRTNAIFGVSAILTYLAMNEANKSINGHGMNENPSGKEDKLLIPIGGGKTLGIPFLSSIATVPRSVYRAGKAAVEGNVGGVGKELSSNLSIALRPLVDVYSNENYFGDEIYNKNETIGGKAKAGANYLLNPVTGAYTHPYLREGTKFAQGKQGLTETISKGTELPIRWYNTKSIENAPFWQEYENQKKIKEIMEDAKYGKLSAESAEKQLAKLSGKKSVADGTVIEGETYVAYKTSKGIAFADTKKEADLEIAKDKFMKSGKIIEVYSPNNKGKSGDVEFSTRELDGFPFPDYKNSVPGQVLRADLNLYGSGNADIKFHLVSPDGKKTDVPQTVEKVDGSPHYYGLELKIPSDAKPGNYQVYATVNGVEVPGTRKPHQVLNAPATTESVDRYKGRGNPDTRVREAAGDSTNAIVFRLKKDGSVDDNMTKNQYDYALNTNKLQKAKANKDYKTWTNLANQQLDIIDKQLSDPSLDELEQSDLLEKAEILLRDMNKFKGYGGAFTKGKKAKKGKVIKLPGISAPKSISSPKLSVKIARYSAPKRSMSASKIKLSALKTSGLKAKAPKSSGLRAASTRKIKILK